MFSSSQIEKDKSSLLTDQDLEHLYKLVEEKDGGPAWIQMMDRSTPRMKYQAWRRDPEVVSYSIVLVCISMALTRLVSRGILELYP